eukprot:1160198-Pelagomonas_calceolata.AAC.8
MKRQGEAPQLQAAAPSGVVAKEDNEEAQQKHACCRQESHIGLWVAHPKETMKRHRQGMSAAGTATMACGLSSQRQTMKRHLQGLQAKGSV